MDGGEIMSRTELLDHGYVKLIESWGSDERVIEAARMSTSGGFVSWEPYEGHPKGDGGLLRYLYTNQHATPFEFAGAVFEVQAPILVFREWHRHRVQGYNEMSARYAPLPDVNYIPTVQRLMVGGGHLNKQAATAEGAETLTLDGALGWLAELSDVYAHAERVYQSGLRRGVPKELARCPVPVGRYSRMRATAVLRNWLHFLGLRKAETAQWEIRQFAGAVHAILSGLFPRTLALFDEGKKP